LQVFFVGFFQFFETEKVNKSNSALIRTQILHTPGIIWNLYEHILVRNKFIYYIVFLWICLAFSTASNLASKTPCTTNLAHLERGIVAPCTFIFLVLPVANSFRRSEKQFSEF
jgi:hypothetical protein